MFSENYVVMWSESSTRVSSSMAWTRRRRALGAASLLAGSSTLVLSVLSVHIKSVRHAENIKVKPLGSAFSASNKSKYKELQSSGTYIYTI